MRLGRVKKDSRTLSPSGCCRAINSWVSTERRERRPDSSLWTCSDYFPGPIRSQRTSRSRCCLSDRSLVLPLPPVRQSRPSVRHSQESPLEIGSQTTKLDGRSCA
jgi:hypothetical protein